MLQISYDDGSGGYHSPCSASAFLTSALNSPGCTTAVRVTASTVISRIRSVDSTIPLSNAVAPPDNPLPAPRGTTATGFPADGSSARSWRYDSVIAGSVTTMPSGSSAISSARASAVTSRSSVTSRSYGRALLHDPVCGAAPWLRRGRRRVGPLLLGACRHAGRRRCVGVHRALRKQNQSLAEGDVVVLDRLPDLLGVRHPGGLCSVDRSRRRAGRQVVRVVQMRDGARCGLIDGVRRRRGRCGRVCQRTRRGRNRRRGERRCAPSSDPCSHSFVDAHPETPRVLRQRLVWCFRFGAEFVTEPSAAAMATGFFDPMTPILLPGGWRLSTRQRSLCSQINCRLIVVPVI